MRPVALGPRRKSLAVNLAGAPERWGDSMFYPIVASSADEELDVSFESYVGQLYKRSGPVFACVGARMHPFSEARFQMQEIVDGRPGRLHHHTSLVILEEPWQNATTGDLLARMLQDADLAGNAYLTPVNGRIRRLRPDWVSILSAVIGDPEASPWDLQAEILGYVYSPQDGRGRKPVFLTPERVVHFAPTPDPAAQWRGMSWLTPVLEEVASDKYATRHKRRFFEKGATLGTVISYDKSITPAQFQEAVRIFRENHQGADKAYETLHVGGGADPKVVGADLKQLDFKSVQGAGETRIAAASGVGAIMARFSEGLQGSSLNTGNYEAAKRQFVDTTLRPLWRNAAGCLAKLVTVPSSHRLWYDVRDVEFLKADRKDAAEIQSLVASTIKSLTDAGYTPASVVDAVESQDFTRLEHSGLYSVQLQAPGTEDADKARALSTAEQLQKIYLAVDKVITSDEARALVGMSTPGPEFSGAQA